MGLRTYRTQVLRATETIYRTADRPSVIVHVNAEEDPESPCYDYEEHLAPSAAREAAGRFIKSLHISTTVGKYHGFHLIVRVWMGYGAGLWVVKGDWIVDLHSGLSSRKARATP